MKAKYSNEHDIISNSFAIVKKVSLVWNSICRPKQFYNLVVSSANYLNKKISIPLYLIINPLYVKM